MKNYLRLAQTIQVLMMQAGGQRFSEGNFSGSRNYLLSTFGSSVNIRSIATGVATYNTSRNSNCIGDPLSSTGVRE
jgi:hypothetical protein